MGQTASQRSTEVDHVEVEGTRDVPLDVFLSSVGYGWFHVRLLVACGFGFSAAAIEIVLTAFLFVELRKDWDINEYMLAVLPVVASIGSTCGELVWGPVADTFGRRWVFIITALITAVFGCACAVAPSIFWLCVLRFFVGLGYGGNIAVDFTLYTEFLPTEGRGMWLFCLATFWPLGQVVACLIAWATIPRYGWRVYLVCCALPSLLSACLRPLMPESPRWLLVHGREKEATEVCQHIAHVNGKTAEDCGLCAGVCLSNEVAPLTVGNSGESHGACENAFVQDQAVDAMSMSRIWLLFDQPLLPTTVGILTFSLALRVSGYGILTLMPTFLNEKGIGTDAGYHTMILNGLATFPGLLGAMGCAIYFGRLLPMKCSLIFVSMGMLLFSSSTSSAVLRVSAAGTTMVLEGAYGLYHTYIPEAYPTEIRATAFGAISAISSAFAIFVPAGSAYMLEHHGGDSLMLVMAFLVACGGVLSALFLHIETKGRDLEDRIPTKTK